MFKREYLGQDEAKQFLIIGFSMGIVEKILKEWGSRNFLTPLEKKSLKMVHTYLLKFYDSVSQRLNKKALGKLIKQMKQLDVLVIDNYRKEQTLKKLQSETVNLDREEFYTFGEYMMDCNCKNCTKEKDKCRLYQIFNENDMPEVPKKADYMPNCPYSY